MKNGKLFLVIGLGLVSVTAFGHVASAAPVNGTTEGTVKFEKPEGPKEEGPFNLVKPGTSEEWITIPKESGAVTLDATFGFSFIPNLDFGTVKVSPNDARHNLTKAIKYQDYDLTAKKGYDAADGTREVKYLPPFLQVINLRGNKQPYKVLVSASKFTSPNKTLENTRLEVKDFNLRNNRLDKAQVDTDASSIFTIPTGEVANQGYITLKPDTEVELMKTKADKLKEADGSASSLVFGKEYSSVKKYTETVAADYDSVRLFVPAEDAPEAEQKYTSVLTWTLSDAL